MRPAALRICSSFLFLCTLLGPVLSSAQKIHEIQPTQTPAKSSLTKLQLRKAAAAFTFTFQPNVGQSDPASLFVASGPDYALGLTRDGFHLISFHRTSSPSTALRPAAFSAGANPLSASGPQDALTAETASLTFEGANPLTQISGLDPALAKVNYIRGNDPSRWHTNVPGYTRVRYANLYPGIDLVFYGESQRHLEYDLVVAPGADPGQVRLRVSGREGAVIDAAGNLLLGGAHGSISLMRPVLYQTLHNSKRAIAGSFVKLSDGEFGFAHADYDRTRPLIIDPQLNVLYATYAGGIHNDEAIDMTLDASGNTYLTGYSASTDFPVSGNAYQQSRQNNGTYTYDVVILKFDTSGNLLFSTFLGGSQNEQGEGIRVAPSGLVYVGGYTGSTDFPVTANALQPAAGGGQDAFFAVLSNDGSQLVYSTYVGGSGDENIYRMIQDASGNLWVAGAASAAGLTATSGAYQAKPNGSDNGFVAELTYTAANPQPLAIDALTFLGGSTSGQEGGLFDVSLDATGNVYVGGTTNSTDFPTTANAYQQPSAFTLSGGCSNSAQPNSIATVAELSANLKTLIYSTVLGGKTEDQNGYPVCNQFTHTVHPDGKGNIWAVGITGMSDFPTTSNALSRQLDVSGYAGADITVAELTPATQNTTLTYGTYLGGSELDYGPRAVWDANNNIWIIATSQSTDWPGIVQGTSLQSANAGGYDATITELKPDGTAILYATYLGGSGDEDASSGRATLALDANNNLYLAGGTGSKDFPVTSGAFQSAYANGVSYADSYDMYYAVLGTGTIGTVGPVMGGNAGDTTITIDGAGYASGATCTLVLGTTTITAIASSVNAAGTSITCTFPLSGATSGSYDVQVANPNGTTFTKPGGFAVQSGGAPDLTVSILGRTVIRTGFPYTFSIEVTNSGTEDAYGIPLWITIPAGLSFAVNGMSAADSAPLGTTIGNNLYINEMVPLLKPGQTTTVPLVITSASDAASLPITATVQAPWFATLDEANAAANSATYTPGCFPSTVNSYAVNCLGSYIADIGTSTLPLTTDARTARPQDDDKYGTPEPKPIDYVNGQNQGINDAKGGKEAAPGDLNSSTLFHFDGYVFGFNIGTMQAVGTAAGKGGSGPGTGTGGGTGNGCTNCPNPTSPTPPSTVQPKSSSSADPNYKSGPTGDSSASRFVRGTPALTYIVGFENEATAALPAAQVVITDPLDTTKVDLSTVSLGTITFGSNTITLPAGTSNYNTTYSLSSTLSVRIQGSIDTNTGVLRWTFTSIDPSTGQPPTDPTVGFLPPDTDGIVGQGSVSFAVSPIAALTTGISISNAATVVFDANAAINTPTWLNTIDADAPTSTVTALPPSEPATAASGSFNVSWSGTDKGSGVASYNIYVSDNGAAFTLWQSSVTTTSATYTGQLNHTYGFYSIATDGAGNMQPAKTTPDTSTTVGGMASTTALTASPSTAYAGQTVTLTATVSAPAGDTTVPTGAVTFASGMTSLGMATLNASSLATLTTTALPIGSDAITAAYAGDANFGPSSSTAVTVTVSAAPPSFTVAASPSTLTIVHGQTGTAMLTVTPTGGFNQAVTFACSGLPAHAGCSFSPTTVTPSGGPASTTLTITTDVTTSALQLPTHPGSSSPTDGGVLACFLLGAGALLRLRSLRRDSQLHRYRSSFLAVALLLLCTIGLGSLTACGGGSGNVTPSGSSTVTVTATSGSIAQTATITVTIQ